MAKDWVVIIICIFILPMIFAYIIDAQIQGEINQNPQSHQLYQRIQTFSPVDNAITFY